MHTPRRILVGLLADEPPQELGWDDRQFLLTGTGRRPLTPQEQAHLREQGMADFPLLS